MKKILWTLLIVLSLGGARLSADEAAVVSTETYYNGFYVGPGIYGAIPLNDDLDPSAYFSGILGYQWNEFIAVEFESGYVNYDFTEVDAEASIVPLLFSLRWNWLVNSEPVEPYIFAGIGVSLNDVSGDAVGTNNIEDSFAAQVGTGFEYYFNDTVSLKADVKFYLNKADWDTRFNGNSELDLYAFMFGFGINFRF